MKGAISLSPPRLVSDSDEIPLDAAGDNGVVAGGDHVDFAADAELRQINAGLDGEAGEGQDAAFVVGFEVVEVGAATMKLGADVVAGAGREMLAETGTANDGAGRVVRLKAGDGMAAIGESLAHGLNRSI